MARLKLSLFGPFLATVDDKPLMAFRTKAAQALLIYLTCEGGDAHRREHLMALLWPGLPQKSAQAWPAAGTPERRAYNYWLHYAEGTFAPLMLLSLVMGRIEDAPVPFFLKPVPRGIAKKVRDGYLGPNVTRNLAFMESTLANGPWFCGERFSAADVQMSFALEAAEVRTDLSAEYPHLAAFLETIRARPAYQQALDKGGHYELMRATKR